MEKKKHAKVSPDFDSRKYHRWPQFTADGRHDNEPNYYDHRVSHSSLTALIGLCASVSQLNGREKYALS